MFSYEFKAHNLLQRIVENNDYTRLRIISAGVRGFIRQDSSQRADFYCKWRIPSESVLETLPYLGDGKIIELGLAELRVFLKEQYPPVSLSRSAVMSRG